MPDFVEAGFVDVDFAEVDLDALDLVEALFGFALDSTAAAPRLIEEAAVLIADALAFAADLPARVAD